MSQQVFSYPNTSNPETVNNTTSVPLTYPSHSVDINSSTQSTPNQVNAYPNNPNTHVNPYPNQMNQMVGYPSSTPQTNHSTPYPNQQYQQSQQVQQMQPTQPTQQVQNQYPNQYPNVVCTTVDQPQTQTAYTQTNQSSQVSDNNVLEKMKTKVSDVNEGYQVLGETLRRLREDKLKANYLETENFDPTQYDTRAAIGLCRDKIEIKLKELQRDISTANEEIINKIEDENVKKAMVELILKYRANSEAIIYTLEECFKDISKVEETLLFKLEEFTSNQHRFNEKTGIAIGPTGERLPMVYQYTLITRYTRNIFLFIVGIIALIFFLIRLDETAGSLAIDKATSSIGQLMGYIPGLNSPQAYQAPPYYPPQSQMQQGYPPNPNNVNIYRPSQSTPSSTQNPYPQTGSGTMPYPTPPK